MPRLTVTAIVLLGLLAACQGEQASLDVVVNSTGDPTRAWVSNHQGVPERPAWSDEWSEWVVAAGATPLSALTVRLTVPGEARVTAVRVKVLTRRPPIAGTQYVVVGADPVTTGKIEFDLDGSPGSGSPGTGPLGPRPVLAADGDTLTVTVQTQQCDCDFVIELDWSGGTSTVDNNGKPFRVSASTATTGRCVTYPDRVEKCENF